VPLGKVVGLKMLYNFGLRNFFPPRAVQWAVTMCCYNVHAKTYFNRITITGVNTLVGRYTLSVIAIFRDKYLHLHPLPAFLV